MEKRCSPRATGVCHRPGTKGTRHDRRVGEHAPHPRRGVRRERDVGVEEEEHVSRRDARSRVHLRAASARRGDEPHAREAPGDLRGAIATPPVDHDHLGDAGHPSELLEALPDPLLLVQHGDDDGDTMGRRDIHRHGSAPPAEVTRPRS